MTKGICVKYCIRQLTTIDKMIFVKCVNNYQNGSRNQEKWFSDELFFVLVLVNDPQINKYSKQKNWVSCPVLLSLTI